MNEMYTASEPQLSFWGYMTRAFTSRYATFTGRARRKEFWATYVAIFLINFILSIVLAGGMMQDFIADPDIAEYMAQDPLYVYTLLGGNIFFWIYLIISIVLMIPTLAMLSRRYHDLGLSSTVFWALNWVTPVGTLLTVVILLLQNLAVAGVVSIVGILSMIVGIINLVIGFIPGKVGPNAYGPDPKPVEVPTWDQQI